MKLRPEIIQEDDDLILVNKPAGYLTIPDRQKPEWPNLRRWLETHYPEVWTVHRLDRDTSGVICFARHAEAHRHLSLQFQNRTVHKYYLAITDGHPPRPSGEIDQPIGPHPSHSGQMRIDPRGKVAQTRYQVQERYRLFSVLRAQILTGRTHQIRVHLASLGCPLLVDSLYGKRTAFFLSEIKGKQYNLGKHQEERPLISRLTLHALELTIQHPRSEEAITVAAPLPKDLRALLRQLDKWGK